MKQTRRLTCKFLSRTPFASQSHAEAQARDHREVPGAAARARTRTPRCTNTAAGGSDAGGVAHAKVVSLLCVRRILRGALGVGRLAFGGGQTGVRYAGFPLQFAVWHQWNLVEVRGGSLAFDIVLGFPTLIAGALMCVRSASIRPPSNLPKGTTAALVMVALVSVLFWAPCYYALVDKNAGALGREFGLYPEARPVEQRDPGFPLKKE